MKDITQQLLEDIRKTFMTNIDESESIKTLYKAIEKGTATYADAEDYAKLVGEALSQAIRKHISSDTLPGGTLYYNIADRVIRPLLEEEHRLISDATLTVQEALNNKAKIGLKPQNAQLDSDRVDGIIDKISDATQFDDVAWMIEEPLINLALSFVTNVLKANVEFQGEAGLKPKITRTHEVKACKWCRNLAGTYSYPELPHDVYRRHERCRCRVTYDPGDGKKQDVHTKQWKVSKNEARTEARRLTGLKVGNTTIKKTGSHTTKQLASRNITIDGIQNAITNPLQVKTSEPNAAGRTTMEVIGKRATLKIDPDTGTILTAYPTHSRTAKKYKRKGRGK